MAPPPLVSVRWRVRSWVQDPLLGFSVYRGLFWKPIGLRETLTKQLGFAVYRGLFYVTEVFLGMRKV